jgi:hypothetical protein
MNEIESRIIKDDCFCYEKINFDFKFLTFILNETMN